MQCHLKIRKENLKNSHVQKKFGEKGWGKGGKKLKGDKKVGRRVKKCGWAL